MTMRVLEEDTGYERKCSICQWSPDKDVSTEEQIEECLAHIQTNPSHLVVTTHESFIYAEDDEPYQAQAATEGNDD